MGKKRITVIGSPEEQDIKSKRATKLEQKKIREGKMTAKAPGLPGGQRIVDTSEESLREYEEIQKRLAATPVPESTDTPITPRRPVRIRRHGRTPSDCQEQGYLPHPRSPFF